METELETYWRDIRNVPDFLYRVDEGYGLDTMAIWRLKCHKFRTSTPHIRPNGPGWNYSYDKALWLGTNFKMRPEYTSGQVFLTSARQLDRTLEEALQRFERIRAKHIQSLEESALRSQKEAEERIEWATKAQAKAEEFKAFRLPSLA